MKRLFCALLWLTAGLAGSARAAAIYGADATLSSVTNAASAASVLTLGQTGTNSILWAFVIQDGPFGGPNVYYGSQTLTAYAAPAEFNRQNDDGNPIPFYVQPFYLLDPAASGATLNVAGGSPALGDARQQSWEYYTFSYGNVAGLGNANFGNAHYVTGSSDLTVTASLSFSPMNPESSLLQLLFVGAAGLGLGQWPGGYSVSGGTTEKGLTVNTLGDLSVGEPFGDKVPGSYGPLTLTQSYYPGYVVSAGYACVFEMLPVGTPTLTATPTGTPVLSATDSPTPNAAQTTAAQATETSVVLSYTPTNTPTPNATQTTIVQATQTANAQATGTSVVLSYTSTDTPTSNATQTYVAQATQTANAQGTATAVVLSYTPTDTETPNATQTYVAQATQTANAQGTETAVVLSYTPTDTDTPNATQTYVVQATQTANAQGTETAVVLSYTPTDTETPNATQTYVAQATQTANAQGTETAVVLSYTPTDTDTPNATQTYVAQATQTANAQGTETAVVLSYTPNATQTYVVQATQTANAQGTATAVVLSYTPTDTDTPNATQTYVAQATQTANAQGTETAVVLSYTPTDTETPNATQTYVAQATQTANAQGTETAVVLSYTPTPTPSMTSTVSQTQTSASTVVATPTGSTAPFQVVLYPNPVRNVGQQVTLIWQPSSQLALVSVYDLSGALVRSFGLQSSPMLWNLRSAGGGTVAYGVYIVCVRVSSHAIPLFDKLAVY